MLAVVEVEAVVGAILVLVLEGVVFITVVVTCRKIRA